MAMREPFREAEVAAENYSWLVDLFHKAAHPISFINTEGTLLAVNRSFESLTGYSADELVGKRTYSEITPGEYREWEKTKAEEILRTGKTGVYEKEDIRKDGTRVPILLDAFRVDNQAGEPVGLGAIFTEKAL